MPTQLDIGQLQSLYSQALKAQDNQQVNKFRLAINGFGRIGRNVLRALLERQDWTQWLTVVAINDLVSPETLLHLLNYDSTYGRLSQLGVQASIEHLDINKDTNEQTTYLCLKKADIEHRIYLLQEPSPDSLPWQALQIDAVLECTGHFRSYQGANRHRQAGAKQVIIGAAPFDDVDASVVMGVNHTELNRHLPIISSVSCTTQALVPLIFTLDKAFGIESVMMTEIHAVTADQNVLDQVHRDLRRARASGYNIIPTTSSSIAATEKVLPSMQGRINGHSIRVPTIDVAAIDVNFIFKQDVVLADIEKCLQHASKSELKGIMGYTDEPLVSSDFIHQSESLIIDGQQLMQVGKQVKVFAWYDNEWGYANRLLDMCVHLAKMAKN